MGVSLARTHRHGDGIYKFRVVMLPPPLSCTDAFLVLSLPRPASLCLRFVSISANTAGKRIQMKMKKKNRAHSNTTTEYGQRTATTMFEILIINPRSRLPTYFQRLLVLLLILLLLLHLFFLLANTFFNWINVDVRANGTFSGTRNANEVHIDVQCSLMHSACDFMRIFCSTFISILHIQINAKFVSVVARHVFSHLIWFRCAETTVFGAARNVICRNCDSFVRSCHTFVSGYAIVHLMNSSIKKRMNEMNNKIIRKRWRKRNKQAATIELWMAAVVPELSHTPREYLAILFCITNSLQRMGSRYSVSVLRCHAAQPQTDDKMRRRRRKNAPNAIPYALASSRATISHVSM